MRNTKLKKHLILGKVPQIYLGRDKLVENIVESLEDGTGPYQTSMILWYAGCGKDFSFS